MIKYNLICSAGHDFEIWFSKSADYDEQAPKGLIACPYCGDSHVEKAIMAPNISTSRKKEKRAQQRHAASGKAMAMLDKAAQTLRDEIAANCEDVGDKFADEARAIHYGEREARGIYGQASAKDARALREEGIEAISLPDAIAPKKGPLN